LRHCVVVGEGLEETLKDLRKHTRPYALAFIVISDFEK
jgi:hypothetical protein